MRQENRGIEMPDGQADVFGENAWIFFHADVWKRLIKLGLLGLFEKNKARAQKALELINSGDSEKAAAELEELIEEM